MLTPASPDGTAYVMDGQRIFDESGNGWFIDNGQVAEQITDSSGTQTTLIDADTANVVAVAFVGGVVWQLNAQGLWWAKTGGPGSYDGWTSGAGTDNSNGTRVSPLPPSASGTVIAPVAAISPSPLVDAAGNLYWISSSGQVVENGVVDSKTANVTEMAYVDGVIWQENASNRWWAKTGGPGSFDGWTSGPGTYNSHGTYVPPVPSVPATLTWVGGGNNEASNPADWNSPSLPAAGDELLFPVKGGTMNVAGNALAGDTVDIDGPGVPPAAPCTFNLSDRVSMSISCASQNGGTVNLANNSKWVGGYYGNEATDLIVQATGTGSGEFDNTNSSVFGSMIVNAKVVGTGIFNVTGAHADAKLEFMHAVGASQSIDIGGGGYSDFYGTLQVDDPGAFHAAVTLGFGDMVLEGLKATSYSLANDILALYKGSSVLETVKLAVLTVTLTENEPADFGVSQTASGISIHDNGAAYSDGGTLLPLHT